MRTDPRELLAVGIFGRRSHLGNRIESLLRRGRTFSPRPSLTGVIASALALTALLLGSSLAPRWIAFAQQQQRSEFEVASIKPNTSPTRFINIRPPVGGRYTETGATLNMLIGLAYKVKPFEISGGPAWIGSDPYDITAKAADSNITDDQFHQMLQSLLASRFKLIVHTETKQVPVYALLPAKGGLKLPEAKDGGCVTFSPDSPPAPPKPGERPPMVCGGFLRSPNFLQAGKVGTVRLANVLSDILGRPVIDKTGFTGTFDVHLEYSPEGTTFGGPGFGPPPTGNDATNPDTSRPSIFTALQEQLGLRLESQKGPGEILIIDHAEKPDAN